MRINFVMSNNVQSGIFNAITNFFIKYLPEECELFVSEKPLKGMDIYHYHRPNLEKHLLKNSVVTVHHDLQDTDPWFDASCYIDRYREANKIICLNSLQKLDLMNNYDIENTVIIPHGVDKNIFSPNIRKVSKRKLKIAIISKRYGRRVKGEAYLLELFKRLNNEKISFSFLGEGRNVSAIIANDYGFETEVFEYLPYSIFPTFYKNIDILLIPSLYEGGPANLPEALYTKTPVISRNIAMMKDYIINNKNGFLLSDDPEKDSDLINKIASNKNNIYTNFLNNLRNDNTKVLDWKDVVNKHVELYKTILEEV